MKSQGEEGWQYKGTEEEKQKPAGWMDGWTDPQGVKPLSLCFISTQ